MKKRGPIDMIFDLLRFKSAPKEPRPDPELEAHRERTRQAQASVVQHSRDVSSAAAEAREQIEKEHPVA